MIGRLFSPILIAKYRNIGAGLDPTVPYIEMFLWHRQACALRLWLVSDTTVRYGLAHTRECATTGLYLSTIVLLWHRQACTLQDKNVGSGLDPTVVCFWNASSVGTVKTVPYDY